MNNKIILISIFALVFFTGCTGLPFDLGNFFQNDVIQIQPVYTQEGVRDVVVISNKQTIPSSPMLPDTPVLFSFIVENVDDLKDATNIDIELFDAPTFYDGRPGQEDNPCNSGVQFCSPSVNDQDDCSKAYGKACDILPGEQKLVNFKLLSPDDKDIAGIKTETALSFKLDYDFSSSLVYVVPVVNFDEVIQRQRAGDTATLTLSKSQSSGPLQIDVEIQGTNYILADQTGILNFKIKNVGKGNVINSEIEPSKLNIIFPPDLPVTSYTKGLFDCGGKDTIKTSATDLISAGGYAISGEWDRFWDTFSGVIVGNTVLNIGNIPEGSTVCTNIKPIELFRDETQTTMRFEVRKNNLNVPFRSYDIRATVAYTYELRDKFDVTINPYGNR
jgi:hypothetical protein